MALKIQMRISLLMNHQNVGVSGATHDRVGEGKAIPAPEIMTLRTTPKTTPLSLRSSGMKGKRVNTAPKYSPITRIRKIVTITYLRRGC